MTIKITLMINEENQKEKGNIQKNKDPQMSGENSVKDLAWDSRWQHDKS